MRKPEPETPKIAAFIFTIGWITIIGGVLAALFSLDNPDWTRDLGVVISGVVFVGFGSIVDLLSRIEQRLRFSAEREIATAPAPSDPPDAVA